MKKIIATLIFSALALSSFSQELTAKKLADEAVAKKSPEKALAYISAEINKITVPSEKRAAYTFLGSLQESMSKYADAQKSYATAAGIAGGNADGMPKKSSERLVVDAIRCALSAGDYENAENYLNSAVRNSKNPEIQAYIKLYEQWSSLCKAETVSDTIEPIAMLKAYLEIPSLSAIKPSVLLTLWYFTGDSKYSVSLNSEFPKSSEAGIVNGRIQIYPAPFWYFTPRKNNVSIVPVESVPETASVSADIQIEKVKTVGKEEISSAETKKTQEKTAVLPVSSDQIETSETTSEKPSKQQLGLFRDKNNAQNFVNRLKDKGFTAYINEETRSSGTIYYSVLVNENKDGSMGEILKSAGFECYPIF